MVSCYQIFCQCFNLLLKKKELAVGWPLASEQTEEKLQNILENAARLGLHWGTGHLSNSNFIRQPSVRPQQHLNSQQEQCNLRVLYCGKRVLLNWIWAFCLNTHQSTRWRWGVQSKPSGTTRRHQRRGILLMLPALDGWFYFYFFCGQEPLQ